MDNNEVRERVRGLLTAKLPLFAILRGVEPAHAVQVARALVAGGFEIIEVTMNSPRPIDSIRAIRAEFGDQLILGAGTVTRLEEVDAVADAGAQLVVSPHCNTQLIAHAVAKGMIVLPGVLTPSEMFAALSFGATGLKIFPAEIMPPETVRAVRAVLPVHVPIYVVGGVNADNMAEYLAAGAYGFGLGGALFRPGKDPAEIESAAREIVTAFTEARSVL